MYDHYDDEDLINRTREKRAQERSEAQAKARRAEEAALAAIPLLEEEKALATEIHERMCKLNHTDYCGWFYAKETDEEWNQDYSRKEYIGKARAVLGQTDFKTAMNVIGALK